MKILMQSRLNSTEVFGGDIMQMEKTQEYLIKLGIDVDINTSLNPDVSNYDVVHIFNIMSAHDTYIQCKNAIEQNKIVIISPIYQNKKDIRHYQEMGLYGVPKILRKVIRSENLFQLVKTLSFALRTKKYIKPFFYQLITKYEKQQKYLLDNAKILLPNSKEELNSIIKDFNCTEYESKSIIVVNGIEIKEDDLNNIPNKFVEKFGITDFILCSGRIEPLKNQLKIVEIFKGTDIPIVFAGNINLKHKKYAKLFKKNINENKNMHYVGFLDSNMMYFAFKACKVNILASWFETTGLVGLEAGIMGANVVITNKGYTKEYFKDKAWYCDPESLDSIKEAVYEAYNAPRQKYDLKELVENNYTWNIAANKTLEAYKFAITQKNRK